MTAKRSAEGKKYWVTYDPTVGPPYFKNGFHCSCPYAKAQMIDSPGDVLCKHGATVADFLVSSFVPVAKAWRDFKSADEAKRNDAKQGALKPKKVEAAPAIQKAEPAARAGWTPVKAMTEVKDSLRRKLFDSASDSTQSRQSPSDVAESPSEPPRTAV